MFEVNKADRMKADNFSADEILMAEGQLAEPSATYIGMRERRRSHRIMKRLKLPQLRKLKRTTNFAQTVGLVSLYVSSAFLGKVRHRDRNRRLGFYTRNIGVYTRRALKIFNLEVQTFGFDRELMRDKRFLMVGNHMSYIDIFVLASVQPSVFVTSVDLGEQFFLGDIAELGGSIFVERRTRSKVERDINVIADTLRAGHHVMIYPEGTSTNGERILPFKKSLLMAAVRAEVDILPVVLKYVEVDGKPFSHENRDRLCWYGDMPFFSHLMGLMGLKSVKAELHFLEPIRVTPESDRRQLADQAYQAISSVYGDPLSVLSTTPTN